MGEMTLEELAADYLIGWFGDDFSRGARRDLHMLLEYVVERAAWVALSPTVANDRGAIAAAIRGLKAAPGGKPLGKP